MQNYAEDAVQEHIHSLQKTFFKEKRNRSYAPFSRNIKKEDIDIIMKRAMKQSDRYLKMKAVCVLKGYYFHLKSLELFYSPSTCCK